MKQPKPVRAWAYLNTDTNEIESGQGGRKIWETLKNPNQKVIRVWQSVGKNPMKGE